MADPIYITEFKNLDKKLKSKFKSRLEKVVQHCKEKRLNNKYPNTIYKKNWKFKSYEIGYDGKDVELWVFNCIAFDYKLKAYIWERYGKILYQNIQEK